MGNDARLQKIILDPSWLDLSFGEPIVVTNALYSAINRFGDPFKMPTIHDLHDWTYQPASGNPELVKLLEKKHEARVVICNGAKQALAATMVAFRKQGCKSVYFDVPYYPANPSFVDNAGMYRMSYDIADCSLITSPNNPDGRNYSNVELIRLAVERPLIHDAAYYTPVYLPNDQMPIPIGRVQIYSMSKMYGMSGIRIGYAVCHDERYYKDIVDYMEESTAGVSTASQQVALEIERYFANEKSLLSNFEQRARLDIENSRKELINLDPEVLTVKQCQSNSMFAWCLAGPRLDYKAAKVYMLEGTLFGAPGMMRLNIAHPREVIAEAVKRLNEYKI